MNPPMLHVVVCAAGPAPLVSRLITHVRDNGWDCAVIATPAAAVLLDLADTATRTGHPVRTDYRRPDQPRPAIPDPDAVIVAPATFNTINKLAHGISDNYALTSLAETIGTDVPVVILPFVNSALASRQPFQDAVTALRNEGVRILLGPDGFRPHPPGTGNSSLEEFPWYDAFAAAKASYTERSQFKKPPANQAA